MNEPDRTEVSPLQDIERRVQLRAKETSLDMAEEGGRAQLRALIAKEVAAWSDGYKRGLRAFDLADPDVVAERAFRNLAGYGCRDPVLASVDKSRDQHLFPSDHLLVSALANENVSSGPLCPAEASLG